MFAGGKRTYQTVNADGVFNVNFYSNFGFKIKGFSWRNGIGPTFSLRRNVELVNDVKNMNTTRAYGLEISTSTYKAEHYNVWISANINWNDSKATASSRATADYWSINLQGSGSKTIAKKFDVGSDISLQMRQKDPRFPDNNSYTTWNGRSEQSVYDSGAGYCLQEPDE